MSFNQSKTADSTELIMQSATIDDYQVMLCEAIDKLKSHSYKAKS